MEIVPENDATKAKRQSILSIVRDATLTSQEKQQRIQALHTAPGHAVAATAKTPPPEPSPEPPEPSSSPSPPPEDAKPPAADQVAPESAPEVDLASLPTSRGGRRRARANREAESAASSAMSVTPYPKPSAAAAAAMTAKTTAVAEHESPEVAAARKRRDEVMKSATSSSRTRAGTAGGGMRTGARSSRRRPVARIGRSSFADSASTGDDNDKNGEGIEEEGQRRDSRDTTPLMSAASRPTRRRRRLADVRADTANTRIESSKEGDVEDDRKPAAMHTAGASAPLPVEAEDGQLTRPGVVAVSAIDERIARKSSNLGGTSTRNTSATGTSTTAAGVAAAAASATPAAPVAPMPTASSSGAARVGAFSCTNLDDKIARKTAGEGRRAGAASAFSVTASKNAINQPGDASDSINTGARSQSMIPSRTGNSLGGDGDFLPGSRSVSMYNSRRQRRRGGGVDAGVGASATVAAVPTETTVDGLAIGSTATHDEYEENEEAFTPKRQQQLKSPHDINKPHHICCKECGRPYTPPESVNVDETPQTTSGPESRRTLLTVDSTAVSSGDDMAVPVYEDVLKDVGQNNPEQSCDWGSRHSSVLSTTGSGDWGSRGTADTCDFEDDASDAPEGTTPIKSGEHEEESLNNDEVKCNDEGDFRQSAISWGTAAAALKLDDMDLDSQDSETDGEVPPRATANVDCSVHKHVTFRRSSLEDGVLGVSEESLAVEDLEKEAAGDRDLKKDLHIIKEEGTYNEDDDYYYDYDEEHDLQDSYNPAHQTDPFHHYSDHFFADDFMEKGPASRARARRESFKDVRLEGFVLSRDDKCNLFIGFLLIIVITIGVSVPVTLIKKEANDAQNAPTMSPTLVRDSVYTAMLDKIVLETSTSAEVFEDDEAPQTKALQWIAHDDLAGLTADSPNLIQRYSLMCLFFGSGGSSTLLGWDNEDAEDECRWFGVKCKSDIDMVDNSYGSSSAYGNVTSLDLKRTRLAGSLVPEIGSLKHLESLNLGENFLKGAIPPTLYDLTKLQSLVLEKNFFGSYLTEGLGDLSQLETLSLNDNRFESDLPTTIVNLKAMKSLYLYSNSFSGRLIEYILDMPALEVVDVANNMFTGTIIPSIGRLSNLRYLLLGRNSLSGTIPGEIGLLSSLEFLGLGANALQGSLPTEIGQLRSLTRLELARSGVSSFLPKELGNLVNLQLLDASKNSLTGEIPSTLGNLRELLILNLMGNDLSGTIPSDLGRCTSLLEIQLQRNDLSGTVGEEICILRDNYFLNDLRVDCVSKVDCDVSCCTRCT